MPATKRVFLCLALLLGLFISISRSSQAAPPTPDLIQQLEDRSGAPLHLAYHSETGKLRFLSAEPSHPIQVEKGFIPGFATAETAARQFLTEYGDLFGVRDPSRELALLKQKTTQSGRSVVHYQQTHRGIPVLAGELNVQVAGGDKVLSVNGELLPDLDLDVTPRITLASAQGTALETIAKAYRLDLDYLTVSQPELWIFNPVLLGGPGLRIDALVWRMEVTSTNSVPIRELVLVHAQAGFVVLHINQMDTVLNRLIYDNDNVPSDTLPGTGPVRVEGGPPVADADGNNAYQFSGDTYDFYSSLFGRDGLDGNGMAMISTVDFLPLGWTTPTYPNAFWTGDQMVFGEGYASAADVVGHEMTHGVTEYESHLFYYYQSGAINEALSDIFGELIDLANGDEGAADTPWLVGEDLPGGAIRSMSNPTAFGDPDRMTHSNYSCYDDNDDLMWDNGGVHQNSGVANKAAYLLAQSDQPSLSFNGVTVTPIGPEKTARVFYAAQTELLLSGSDYQDLYNALPYACSLLVGQNGITTSDCQEVQNAVNATEMNLLPTGCGAAHPPVCGASQTDTTIFDDNFENPYSGLWASYGVDPVQYPGNHWYYPQNPNYLSWLDATTTTSGYYNLYGFDFDNVGDYAVALTSSIPLPAADGLYLSFNHSYVFEDGNAPGFDGFDGGVLEYSTDGSWVDAGDLIAENGYTGTIDSSYYNPLGGRDGFTNESYGTITTRVNLTDLSGEDILIRFRIGTDLYVADYGWFIDDVRIYSCSQPTESFNKNGPANGAAHEPLKLTLDWSESSAATAYEYCYDTSDNDTCSSWTTVTTGTQAAISGLTNGTTYYWQARALNGGGLTEADEGTWWSFTTLPVPGSPSSLSASAVSQTRIDLGWTDNSDDENDFHIERSPNGSSGWSEVGLVDAVSINYSDTGLACGTPYHYRIRSHRHADNRYSLYSGTTLANTEDCLPGHFSKVSPANAATNQPLSLTLAWQATTPATRYEYCYDASDYDDCTTWVTTANTSAAIGGLEYGTTYYWQVRAYNGTAGPTEADEGVWWGFSTIPLPDSPSEPDATATSQTQIDVTWTDASDDEADFHIERSANGSPGWSEVGTVAADHTGYDDTGLACGTPYYYRIRAHRHADNAFSSYSSITHATTHACPPAGFSKTSPSSGSIDQPVSLILSWQAASPVTKYEYCYDDSNDNLCSGWVDNGLNTSAGIDGLDYETTYYWQVRAWNGSTGPIEANEGSWWTFDTQAAPPSPPGAFAKSSPINGAEEVSTNPTLSWGSSTGATHYEYCYDTSDDDACTAWASTSSTSIALEGLSTNTVYYWQVRSWNGSPGPTYADGAGTAFRAFTTQRYSSKLFIPLVVR